MSDRIDQLVDVKLQRLRFDPERLRRCRALLGVNRVELGAALHVHSATVQAWELGTNRPTEEHVAALEHFMQRAEQVAERGPD